jgi:two-component system phosphate regulon sensor histidine kinase PhoR
MPLWTKLKNRVFVRGESAVASVGIAGAAILLAVLAACGWWTRQAVVESQTRGRTEQLQVVGALLSQSAESMLASDQLSDLRRMVADAGRNYQLSRCRITLAEDQVVADAEPNRINVRTLPAVWSAGVADAQTNDSSMLVLSYPLNVRGRGGARLEIAAALTDPHRVLWDVQTGIAAIGALAMAVLLLVYRGIRGQLMAVGAIRESLLALHMGETASETLLIDQTLGHEAAAWNKLLENQDKLKKQAVAEHTIDRLDARRGVKSDSDAVWDAIPQGLVLVNGDMTLKAANGPAAVLLKRRREELPGSKVSDTIKDVKVLETIRSVAAGVTQRAVTLEVERPATAEAGLSVLRFSVRPVRKDDPAAAMLVIEDVTQMRVAEQARNSLIAQVTHELRTPLTNIRLYVETAIEDGEDDPAVRSNCMNVINLETRRLERIVSEMLSVAEIEAGSFQVRKDDVYMDVLLDEIKSDYAAQAADKKITLEFTRPPKLPRLVGDRDKIALALHNLVGNALKYTPSGGKVIVASDVREGQFAIDVIDSGIGIKPEEAERVFEKFYRSTDPRVGKITGTGLGLTLAREVIRLHSGDITLQSEIDHGSTFTATLPVPKEAA